MTFNVTPNNAIEFFLTRRSVKAREMTDIEIDAGTIDQILRAGARVPDHGKLAPWRFFVFTGQAREAFGKVIVDAYWEEDDTPTKATAKGLGDYPMQAPLMIAVASTPSDSKPIPVWEQHLSAGAAAMQMLNAGHALGLVGQWLTGWPAYSKGVHRNLGLKEGDQLAGYLFFGGHPKEISERPRPDLADVVTHYSPKT